MNLLRKTSIPMLLLALLGAPLMKPTYHSRFVYTAPRFNRLCFSFALLLCVCAAICPQGHANPSLPGLLSTGSKGHGFLGPQGTAPAEPKVQGTAGQVHIVTTYTFANNAGGISFIVSPDPLEPWSSAVAYSVNAIVTYGGTAFVALQPSTNIHPGTGLQSSAYWAVPTVSTTPSPTLSASPIWTTVTSGGYSLKRGDHILADSTGWAFTMILPPATGSGAEINVRDPKASWFNNNVTLTGTVNGDPQGLTLTVAGSWANLVDVGGSTGWKVNFIY